MPTTLILGASENPERYANKAQHQLLQHGHSVVLVNPKGGVIDGVRCYPQLAEVHVPIDTVTVYVQPSILLQQLEGIAALKPRRVIFNPGTESTQAFEFLKRHKITVEEGCTLVMLSVGSY